MPSTTAPSCHGPQVSNDSTALANMAKTHYVKYGHREPRVYKRIPLALRCVPRSARNQPVHCCLFDPPASIGGRDMHACQSHAMHSWNMSTKT